MIFSVHCSTVRIWQLFWLQLTFMDLFCTLSFDSCICISQKTRSKNDRSVLKKNPVFIETWLKSWYLRHKQIWSEKNTMLISTIHSSHRPMGTTKISQQNVKLIIIHKDHTLTNSADGLFSTFKSPKFGQNCV